MTTDSTRDDAPGRWPLWAHLFLRRPRAVHDTLRRLRDAGVVDEVPTLWQITLGVTRMVHRLIFRPETVGLSTTAPVRTNLRARLMRVRPLRFPFLLREGAITPLDLSGLTSSRERLITHLLGAHHERHQFVYDLELLTSHPGGLAELRERARAVVDGDDPRAAWLRDLVVFDSYHERLLEAADDALVGRFDLSPEEAEDADISLAAYLRWCRAQPPTPGDTWRALRAGRYDLGRGLAAPAA